VLRRQEGVDDARSFAEFSLVFCRNRCREAATMVMTELAENMIKYSDSSSTFAGTIALAIEGNRVRITASNEVASPTDGERVVQALARIAAADDLEAMYQARLVALFESPRLPQAQLGLLRAAYEGGFRLSCRYEPPLLTVIAHREG
jgi:hypothetical protein